MRAKDFSLRDYLREAVKDRCEYLQQQYGLTSEQAQKLLAAILTDVIFKGAFVESLLSKLALNGSIRIRKRSKL